MKAKVRLMPNVLCDVIILGFSSFGKVWVKMVASGFEKEIGVDFLVWETK